MPAEIDEISLLLGALKADKDEGSRQRDAMFRKLDEMQRSIHEIGGAIKLQVEKHTTLESLVKTDLQPYVEDFKNMKQRGLGVLAFVGLMGGGVVWAVQAVIEHWSKN